MADLTITAASVVADEDADVAFGTAGATVTAGQVVYLDSATDTLKLTDSDSGTAAARSVKGIALHAAAAGQPLAYCKGGHLTIGATVAAGTPYFSSSNAGGICPLADVATGEYPTFLGFGISTTKIAVNLVPAGVAVP